MILFFLACSDQSVGKFNGEPLAEILSHVDGDAVTEAAVVQFSGSATDPDDTDLSVTWSINGTSVCMDPPDADGGTSCAIPIPADSAEVLLEVRDPDGAADSAKLTLDVIPLESPQVAITAPNSGDRGYSDTALALQGTAYDPDTDAQDLSYAWTSSLDGTLAEGTVTTDGIVDDLVFLSEGNHTLTLRVVDPQGYADDAQVALSIGGPNSAPTCTITAPTEATWPADTTLLLEGVVADVDQAADTLSVTWSSDRDGTISTIPAATDGTTSTSTTLSSGLHVLTLSVADELGLGCTDTVVVTVNSPPSAPTVDISPADPVTGSTLIASASGAVDPDGDTLTYHYAWSVDGTDAGLTDASVPPDRTTRGETWTVEVTADDGLAMSAAGTATVTIGNTPPSATPPTLSPDPAIAADTLSCTPGTFADDDGDADQSTREWTINGALAGTGDTLGGAFGRGDLVTCTIHPYDGIDWGTDVSASLTIGNTAPEAPAVTIDPATPVEGDTLQCLIATEADDIDGDTLSYAMSWTRDGVAVAGSTTDWAGDTVSGTLEGEVWTCTATPDDGTAEGATASASVTIGSGAIDYTGTWDFDRTISYSCAFGLVSISATKMTVTDTNPNISVRVSGNPGTMSGGFTSATTFEVDNVLPGTCTETYTMSGTFTGADSFSGSFDASYSGSCFDCVGGSWIFNATR